MVKRLIYLKIRQKGQISKIDRSNLAKNNRNIINFIAKYSQYNLA